MNFKQHFLSLGWGNLLSESLNQGGIIDFGSIMSAFAKTINHGNPESAEDWTVVLPRRGRQRRRVSKIIASEVYKQEAWVPTDDELTAEKEDKLLDTMLSYIEKLEKSKFYQDILDQIEAPEIMGEFLRVRGSQDKMQMVIYGIGSIRSFESPKLQLSLVVLLKRKFSWIGEIEVFDPIISSTESKVMEALGCAVLSVNEYGQRQVSKPTLFFMPHCESWLYDNLLSANWRTNSLNQIVIFGNSFSDYERMDSLFQNQGLSGKRKHIYAINRFSKEYTIIEDHDYYRAFNSSSWHFFNLDSEEVLENSIKS